MNTKKIFETASDLHVAVQFGFVKPEPDNYVYLEKEFKTKLDKKTCANMFRMGNGVLVQNGNEYRIVSATIGTEHVTLNAVKDGSTLLTVYTAEYAA